MNSARKLPRVNSSDPASVLSAISAVQGHIIEEQSEYKTRYSQELTWTLPDAKPEIHDHQSEVEFTMPLSKNKFAPAIKLRIDPSTTARDSVVDSMVETCVESAEQVQQLARLLRENKNELKQRESDLNLRIENWETKVSEQQKSFDLKLRQLEQQATQVQCQQLHLMQLQTDIVKSHEATKIAIETLVTAAGSDQKTVSTLKALKYQLSGRFDYIARRWEHLAKIMQKQLDEKTANSTETFVDWTGEFQ